MITLDIEQLHDLLCHDQQTSVEFFAAVDKARCYGEICKNDFTYVCDPNTGENTGINLVQYDRYYAIKRKAESIKAAVVATIPLTQDPEKFKEKLRFIATMLDDLLDIVPQRKPLEVAAQVTLPCHKKNRNGDCFTIQILKNSFHAWCVQYGGNGNYCHTFDEAAEYCRRRKWDIEGLTAYDLYKKAMITGK